jgi:ABC-2 type transport system ATP-binding protein
MAFFEVADLTKSFGTRQVLNGLSFHMERGEVYGLVGPNGAGKTTTINVLCGLLAPDSGSVRWNGGPLGDRARSQMGIASQEIALYRDLTCAENLRFFAALYGLDRARRATRTAECLRAVALDDRADTRVGQLSGGMQRRLHVALALLHEPKLLVLDEPTVGLDMESRHDAWELIRGLAKGGSTILLTTHQLDEAESLSGRIGILHEGRLVAEGSMEQLRHRVAAAELAVIVAPTLEDVRRRAVEQGLTYRHTPGGLTVWLPERAPLEAVAQRFAGIPLRSLSLRPVGLADVFAEVTGPH